MEQTGDFGDVCGRFQGLAAGAVPAYRTYKYKVQVHSFFCAGISVRGAAVVSEKLPLASLRRTRRKMDKSKSQSIAGGRRVRTAVYATVVSRLGYRRP
jgi:hypothetical protein